MRRKKAMGRNGGNRSTHAKHDIQNHKAASLKPIKDEMDKVREALKFTAMVKAPFRHLVRSGDCIPLFPQELKDRAETFFLFELTSVLRGVR